MPGVFPDVLACQTIMRPHRMPQPPVLTTADVDAVLAAAAVSSGESADNLPESGGVDRNADIVVGASSMLGAASLYSARPRPGCVVPAPGFPTLHTLPFSPSLASVRMNVFGMASRKESMVLAVGGARRTYGGGKRTGKRGHPLATESEDEGESGSEASGLEDEGDEGEEQNGLGPAGGAGDDHDSFLAAAAMALPLNGGGGDDVSGPSPAKRHRTSRLLPAHSPKFSTAYAVGTTVNPGQPNNSNNSSAMTPPPSGGRGGCARDFLSSWKASHPGQPVTARSLAPSLLGRTMYVDWPHLREALLTSLSDSDEEVTWVEGSGGLPEGHPNRVNSGHLQFNAHSPDSALEWSRSASLLADELLSGKRALGVAGVKVDRVDVIVTGLRLVGMRRDPASGALSRVFGSRGSPAEARTVPELILPSHPTPDHRFIEVGPQSVRDRFPVGDKVMVLRGPYRGCLGTVTGYTDTSGAAGGDGDVTTRLDLAVEVPPKETPFGHTIASTIKDKYLDARQAASVLGLSSNALGRITGSVLVMPGKIDLGLNLKVRASNAVAIGNIWVARGADNVQSICLSSALRLYYPSLHLFPSYPFPCRCAARCTCRATFAPCQQRPRRPRGAADWTPAGPSLAVGPTGGTVEEAEVRLARGSTLRERCTWWQPTRARTPSCSRCWRRSRQRLCMTSAPSSQAVRRMWSRSPPGCSSWTRTSAPWFPLPRPSCRQAPSQRWRRRPTR